MEKNPLKELGEKEQKKQKKQKDKWQKHDFSEEELKEIQLSTLEEYESMKQYEKTACYYDPNYSSIPERYKRDDELFLMLSTIDEDGWANYKSSALFRNIQSYLSELAQSEIIDQLTPNTIEDENPVRILEQVIKSNNKKNKQRHVDDRIFSDLLRHGKAYTMTNWKRVVEKKLETKKIEDLDKKEKEELEKGVIPYKWVELTKFDDYYTEPIKASCVLVEKGAYRIHGLRKPASKVIHHDWINFSEFKSKVNSDPEVIKENIEKVKPAGEHEGSTTFWEKKDSSTGLTNQVEEITLFDKENCRIVTIYNDVVLKVAPLPFGEIPIVDYSFIEYDDEFYVPGLGALLDPKIREEEDLYNEIINRIKLEVNPPMFADSRITNEMASSGEKYARGEIVPITGLGENPNMFQSLPVGNARIGEAMNILQTLDQSIIHIAGVDSRRQGSMHKSYNASEVQVVDNATQKMMNMIINNFLKGREYKVQLEVNWILKKYTEDIVRDKYGKKLPEPASKAVKIEGMKFEYDKTTEEQLHAKEIEGVSFFEIPKDLKLISDFSVTVDPKSLPIINKQQKLQQLQNLLPQIAVVMGDERYQQPGQPPAIVSARKTFTEIMRLADLGDLLIYGEVDENAQIEEARTENSKMLKNEYVSAQPGRTLSHIQTHEQFMMGLEETIEDKRALIPEKDPMMMQQMMMMGQVIPETADEKALKDMERALKYVKYHIDVDRQMLGSIIPPRPQEQPNQFGGTMPPMPNAQPGTQTPMDGSPIAPPSQAPTNIMMQ